MRKDLINIIIIIKYTIESGKQKKILFDPL